MKKSFLGFVTIIWGAVSLAEPEQLFCRYFVYGDMEFCNVTLKVREDGSLESPAKVNHQGSSYQSVIAEKELQEGDLYRLFLDADKPGHELELAIKDSKNENGEHSSVLINHQVPFAKEMLGICRYGFTFGSSDRQK
jgi:hypothetical protein